HLAVGDALRSGAGSGGPHVAQSELTRGGGRGQVRNGQVSACPRRCKHQNRLLQCMQDQKLDALMSPMSTVPPRKLTSPREPNLNGRPPIGYSFIGQQGFPAITVPAGFTTQVWDRVRDGNGTKLAAPVAAALPVGVDFIARPFNEGLLVRIASAYEAATRHRRPPPEFGPIAGEP